MNLLRVSFIQSHKTFRHIRGFATAAGNLDTEIVVGEMNRRGDCVTCYYSLITDELSRPVKLLDQMRPVKKGLSPNKTTNYTSLVDSLCKNNRIDEAYMVLNEMIVSGFSTTSAVPLNNIIRGFVRIGEMNQMGDCVTYNSLISEMRKVEELIHAYELLDHMRWSKGLSPNKTTYTSLIDSLCNQDRFDDACRVLNEMFLSGFSPSVATLNNVLGGFLRIRETGKAYEMYNKVSEHILTKKLMYGWWMDKGTYSSLKQGFSDGVTYTSLMNSYLDQGNLFKVDKLLHHMGLFDCLPYFVKNSVFINGLDNKARTTNTNKYILKFNYKYGMFHNPTLEYRRTLAVNYNDDEFKSLVELVESFCDNGDTMHKWSYKPDGIVYSLFIIEHCNNFNVDQAYNMYMEMVHYGFACHMFIVFALIECLKREAMFNELRWVVQNVLRSCNLNDYEIVKFLDEFNPEQPDSDALFNVLAEKAKDGPFLKCSYAPASA